MPQPRDPSVKLRVFGLRAANKTPEYISSSLCVPVSTIYEWCREHRAAARAELLAAVVDMEALSDAHKLPELWDLTVRVKKAVRGMLV